jgi:type II secretory pathway component PulJ
MSQLIALIIAIALGAIVTAIGYVFLGDAFTKNSEKGIAL